MELEDNEEFKAVLDIIIREALNYQSLEGALHMLDSEAWISLPNPDDDNIYSLKSGHPNGVGDISNSPGFLKLQLCENRTYSVKYDGVTAGGSENSPHTFAELIYDPDSAAVTGVNLDAHGQEHLNDLVHLVGKKYEPAVAEFVSKVYKLRGTSKQVPTETTP